MKARNTTVVWCIVIALVAQAPLVLAQSDAPSDEAKREASAHFNRGAELFQEGVYRAALVELKRAYEIAPNYRVLYNIGQTQVALGEFVQAIKSFETFLAEGGAAVDPTRREELATQIAQLRRRTAELSIEVDGGEATVSIDDEVIGQSPLPGSVMVNVGAHRIRARGDDGASASEEIEVVGGDVRSVRLTLVAATSAVAATLPDAAPAPRGLSTRKKWAIGLLASAGGLALAGGTLALITKSASDDYDHELNSRPGDPEAIRDAHDKLSRTALSADVLFGAAIATAISGVVLLVLKDPAREQASELALGLTPGGLVATGRF